MAQMLCNTAQALLKESQGTGQTENVKNQGQSSQLKRNKLPGVKSQDICPSSQLEVEEGGGRQDRGGGAGQQPDSGQVNLRTGIASAIKELTLFMSGPSIESNERWDSRGEEVEEAMNKLRELAGQLDAVAAPCPQGTDERDPDAKQEKASNMGSSRSKLYGLKKPKDGPHVAKLQLKRSRGGV